MKFVLLLLLKSRVQRYFLAQHRRHDIPCRNEAVLRGLERFFSSAFEITLKSRLHFIQPNPGSVGLILPALSVHRSCFSSVQSSVILTGNFSRDPVLRVELLLSGIWPSDGKVLLWF